MRMKREWQSVEAFYQDAATTGRYGGEVDYGCFWSTDEQHLQGRLTWIENTGEWFLYAQRADYTTTEIMLLGATMPKNKQMAEGVMAGWVNACLAHEGFSWICKRLGVYGQTYKTLELAARAYGREHGFTGNGGGWIYAPFSSSPIEQGWSSLGNTLRRRGSIQKVEPTDCNSAWRIIDARSMTRARSINEEVR